MTTTATTATAKPDPLSVTTYVAGEDSGRLANSARYFGLESARRPPRPVRDAVGTLFYDSTLESAMMHSVGAMGGDEHLDATGTLHITLRRRRGGVGEGADRPEYGHLMDLFHRKPLEVEEEEEEEEEEKFEEVDMVEGGSLVAAAFGIVKGTVGPAILYLPRGFELSGYAVAVPSLILATASYLYSARRLLECWRVEYDRSHFMAGKIEEIRALLDVDAPGGGGGGGGGAGGASATDGYGAAGVGTGHGDGGEAESGAATAAAAPKMLSYPELARRSFGGASFFVEIGIALMQYGVCLTYLIFVPQNLYESTRSLFGVAVPRMYFLVAMVAIEVPLSWIRDIRRLTPMNILATMLIAYGLASCLLISLFGVLDSDHDHDRDDGNGNGDDVDVDVVDGDGDDSSFFRRVADLPPLNDTWYLFIGTSFFVFEGSITLLVPLQEAVFRREDKEKFPSVNQSATLSIVAFYVVFAITCWAALGDSVKTALTASLPQGAYSTTVQLAYSVAVIFTFPLQAFPALEVTFHQMEERARKEGDATAIIKRNAVASVLLCALGVVAVLAIDYLGNVVSLLGSLVGIPIALIYPPLMHNRLVKGSSKSTILMNNAVAGIGFLAMAAASFTTIVSWDKGAEG